MNKKIIYIGTLLTTLNAALAANAANSDNIGKQNKLSPVGLALMGGVADPIPIKNAPEKDEKHVTDQATGSHKKEAPKVAAEKKDGPADTAQKAAAEKKDVSADNTQKANAATELNSVNYLNWQQKIQNVMNAYLPVADKKDGPADVATKVAAEKKDDPADVATKVATKVAAEKKDGPADVATKVAAEKKDGPADVATKVAAEKKDGPVGSVQKTNEKAPKMNSLPPINWQPQPKLALTDENKNSAKKNNWPFASKVTAHENDLASQRDYPFEKPLDTRDEKVDDDRKNAVKDGVKDILEPAEIGTVQKKKLDAQGAIAFPGYAGERLPAAKRKDINFSANNIAPTNITLAQNVPSAVVFLDKKGTPWPIESIAYDPRVYSVNGQGCGQDSPAQAINDNRPTNLSITVCNFWTWGTFTVKLENISIPLAFVAESGKKGDDEGFVDVPIVIHITDGVSPSKEKNVVTGNNGSEPVKKSPLKIKKAGKIEQEPVETAYQSFLTGEAPQQATKVATSDSNTAAWIWQGQLYFVTKYQVLAPNYELVANNTDGTVYKFARSTSRIFGTDGYGREHVVMIGN